MFVIYNFYFEGAVFTLSVRGCGKIKHLDHLQYNLGKRNPLKQRNNFIIPLSTIIDRTLNANIIKKNIQNTVLDAESIFDQQVA